MMLALTIIHIVISVVLILTVLLQHGKQQGMSGAIAGGAETFFGKNKGRTIDAMLKKFTAVFAVLFIITSLALAAIAANDLKRAEEQNVESVETDMLDQSEADVTTETAPVEGEAAPVEGETAPVEGEAAPAEGEVAEGEAVAEGETAPAEGEAAEDEAVAE